MRYSEDPGEERWEGAKEVSFQGEEELVPGNRTHWPVIPVAGAHACLDMCTLCTHRHRHSPTAAHMNMCA